MTDKWEEIYTEDQLKIVQGLEIENLKVLILVCKKLDIEFFLYGGTLLGSVRSKGFIPWDDDIDVALTRENYMRFIKEAPALLPSQFFLQTPYTDKNSPYFYTKLRRKNTRCIEYIHHKLKMEQGIYIDIYPVDKIPDSDTEYMKFHKKAQKMFAFYSLRQSPYPSNPPMTLKLKARAFCKFIFVHALRIIPRHILIRKIDGLMTKFEKRHTTRSSVLFYPKLENYYSNLFPLVDGTFENIPVKLPGDWKKHLSLRYGNFMTIPPPENRFGHKPYILDLTNATNPKHFKRNRGRDDS